MNILIIGAGAMGCLFGALLAPVSRVGVFCSQQKLAALLQTRGILVDEPDQASKKLIVQAGSRVTEFAPLFALKMMARNRRQQRQKSYLSLKVLYSPCKMD